MGPCARTLHSGAGSRWRLPCALPGGGLLLPRGGQRFAGPGDERLGLVIRSVRVRVAWALCSDGVRRRRVRRLAAGGYRWRRRSAGLLGLVQWWERHLSRRPWQRQTHRREWDCALFGRGLHCRPCAEWPRGWDTRGFRPPDWFSFAGLVWPRRAGAVRRGAVRRRTHRRVRWSCARRRSRSLCRCGGPRPLRAHAHGAGPRAGGGRALCGEAAQ
mmetsp:Transcript_112657/g.318269  ORF Transcript_112657/g.318269 Transcript_112657/m.318269 type:complete len:215 (-) Transcript_112657:90-734(-)